MLEDGKIKRIILFFVIGLLCISLASAKFTKKDRVYENMPKLYLTGENKGYLVKIVVVSDPTREVVFSVNGEHSKALKEDESFRFSDGSEIIPTTIIIDENGADYVEYYFYGYEGKNLNLNEIEKEIVNDRSEPEKQENITAQPEPVENISAEIQEQQKPESFFEKIINWLRSLLS